MEIVLNKILSEIQHQEDKLSSQMMQTADEAYQMTLFLKEMLFTIKMKVLQTGFKDEQQEINFFKNIKPQILGKLIYYNKVFRVETTCPVSTGRIHQSYFENQLKILKSEYKESISNEDFYRYYRAGRTDRDHNYFRLGKINYHDGLKSSVFEIDFSFSTYFDNKVAHIIANELLYTFLLTKINPEKSRYHFNKRGWKQRHFVDELAKCTDRIDLRPVCFQIYCIRENRHQEISIDFPNPLPNAP